MDTFWQDFGLEANPYDSKPLLTNKEDRRLFVGREKELQKLDTILRGDISGIILVEGEIGVGKTSFVNISQYDAWKKCKVLPAFEKIELTKNMDSTNFMLSVFSNMIFNLEKSLDCRSLMKYTIHKDARTLITQSIDKGWGGNFTIAGFGGGVNSKQTTTMPPTVLLPSVLNLMDKWIEFVIEKTDFDAIVMVIDNLDIMSDDHIIDFLNSMRDNLLGRKHIWWIIIGEKGLLSIIERKAHRVGEIIAGKPIIIEPMSENEINKMIKIRYQNLTIKNNMPLIIPNEIIKTLYEVSKGETRYILKQSTDLIHAFITDFPTIRRIPLQMAQRILFTDAQKRIVAADLTNRQYELLERTAKINIFQLKDFKKFKLNSRQALKDYVDKFLNLNFVIKKETNGKEVYYKTTGDVNIFYDKNIREAIR